MLHQDFINLWNNRKLERIDPSNLNQCFDLAVAYVMDVQGMPLNIYAGLLYAYQIWENPTTVASKNYDFIKNTPYAVPKRGDTLVFSKAINGTAGHVVIVDSADMNVIRAFSQNDPTGSPCIMKNYAYTYVLGWLRKITNCDQQIADLQATEKRLIAEKDALNKSWETKYQTLQTTHATELANALAKCKSDTIQQVISKIQSL